MIGHINPEIEPDGPLDCVKCGEKFAIGKRFVLNNKTGEIWCEDCFREYAMNVVKYECVEGDPNVR